MFSFPIDVHNQFRTVESLLFQQLPPASRGYVHKLIRSKACLCNGQPTTPGTPLIMGDLVTLKESATARSCHTGLTPLIDILWYDERLLIVNKPAGLAMHPAAEVDDSLTERATRWLIDHYHNPHALAYPVNRLDRGTSGVVMLATSSSNAGRFGRYIKEVGLTKQYLAVVEGNPGPEGAIELPLDDKPSLTRFTTLWTSGHVSVLLVEPVSGRMHQIRRHLSMLGFPVLNDSRYGAKKEYPSLGRGIGLHSFTTAFHYPEEDFNLAVTAPLPVTLLDVIERHAGCSAKELFALVAPYAVT